MKKLFFLAIVFFLFIPSMAFSQKNDSLRNLTVSFQPMYIHNSGLRLDFEYRFKSPNQWIHFCPQFYHIPENQTGFPVIGDYDFDNILGFGFNAAYRKYLRDTYKPAGEYIQTSFLYNHFITEYPDDYYVDITKQNINKIGINFEMGYQLISNNYILFDFYGGLGYRQSWYNSDGEEIHYISDVSWSFGYSGVMLVLGVRIGAWF